jgi:hypothetical protein
MAMARVPLVAPAARDAPAPGADSIRQLNQLLERLPE